MTITINSDDPRSIKAVEIAADAGQWLKCRTSDGRKAFGIRSSRDENHVYLATLISCTCPDAQRHQGLVCKHQLAVRLHCELVRAQQGQPTARRPHLRLLQGGGGQAV